MGGWKSSQTPVSMCPREQPKKVEVSGGMETTVLPLRCYRPKCQGTWMQKVTPCKDKLAHTNILESYSDSIMPRLGTLLLGLGHCHTDKLLPVKFHGLDTKSDIILGHTVNT